MNKDIQEILVQNLPENEKSERTADSKRTTNSNDTGDKSQQSSNNSRGKMKLLDDKRDAILQIIQKQKSNQP